LRHQAIRALGIAWQSASAVRAFKLRTFFCLISVALGISSITIIVAATEGAYKRAYDMVERFGPDAVMVISGSDEARAVGQREKTLTLDDIEAVRQAFPTAYLVAPIAMIRGVTVAYRENKYQTVVIGATEDYSRVWSWPVTEGSDLTEEDIRGLRNVGLIGQHLSRRLFGEENPLGKYVLVMGLPIQIVGIMGERGTSPSGENLDDRIVLPLSTAMRKLQKETRYVGAIRVRFLDPDNLDRWTEDLKTFLRQRHRIRPEDPEDFRVFSPREITRFLTELIGSLVIFVGIVGLTCSVVAGFVLANLFLLSVKERSKEIGIRRSVGARRGDIRFQFLSEAVIVTSAGGLLGFLLGIAASKFLVYIADFPIYFSWKAFASGLLLSWAIGIGFGLQPAARAANLEPIEAIRE
jgi:putative ABC transport system permease protein